MAECVAHRFHSPRPQTLDQHHVLPLEWGGDDSPSNVVLICQTGDANVHRLLDEYEKAGQTPVWEVRRQFGPGERTLAAQGWHRYRELNGS